MPEVWLPVCLLPICPFVFLPVFDLTICLPICQLICVAIRMLWAASDRWPYQKWLRWLKKYIISDNKKCGGREFPKLVNVTLGASSGTQIFTAILCHLWHIGFWLRRSLRVSKRLQQLNTLRLHTAKSKIQERRGHISSVGLCISLR